jgi:SAM-dependent methyltransferase
MKKLYDPETHRIICINEAATQDYWDAVWNVADLRAHIRKNTNSWLVNITRRFLKQPALILEGGCGLGNHVYALSKNGYKAIGIDFAPKTVAYLNEHIPELDIRLADVRNLPFEAETFEAYWSLGVIEHFWDGFDEIAQEIQRVLKKNGYLFLTFPWMSPHRINKAKQVKYNVWHPSFKEPKGFYQYILPNEVVSDKFKKLGFDVIYETGLDALKGIKDEVDYSSIALNRLYKSNGMAARIIKKIINLTLSDKYGHIRLMVLRKNF